MARTCVAGDLYESITGQLFEIGRQLRQPSGYPFDPEELKRYLQSAIEGRFATVALITSTFHRDMTKEGWTLLEDVGSNPTIEIAKLKMVSFLWEGETYIGGEDMAKRARDVLGANLGQLHAEYLLEHQNKTPTEWSDYVLVFPGTKWRDPDGNRRVPCLYWGGDRWRLGFGWLGNDWDSLYRRLVRPSKSS